MIAAAQAVARAYGVACDDAVPIAGGSNVLVHLKPAPVVARVMTGTAHLHDDVEAWLGREVAVAAFAGELAVAPTDLLPPGPHHQDGVWMTMWRFVAHDAHAGPPDPSELGASLLRLHAVLAGFPGELPPLSGIRDWLARLSPQARPDLDALDPAVFESPLPIQALHGDASLSNVLHTGTGLVWNDFEDVCAGPVAWDVAGLVSSARARGLGAAYADELLAAYGDPGADLEPFLEAHALYEAIWQA